MSALVSLIVGGVLWRDVLIGAVLAVVASAIKVIELARREMSELLFALIEGQSMAMANRAQELVPALNLLEDEHLPLIHREALRLARQQLADKAFQTLNIEQELS